MWNIDFFLFSMSVVSKAYFSAHNYVLVEKSKVAPGYSVRGLEGTCQHWCLCSLQACNAYNLDAHRVFLISSVYTAKHHQVRTRITLFATLTVLPHVWIFPNWTLQQSMAVSTERQVQQIAYKGKLWVSPRLIAVKRSILQSAFSRSLANIEDVFKLANTQNLTMAHLSRGAPFSPV